jgi:hypothetical protein
MPTHRQTMTSPKVTEKGLGSSSTQLAKQLFANPFGDNYDDNLRAFYQENVLDGDQNDGGHTFFTYNMDFNKAPDLADVVTGGEGLPASPWVPNPVSPGDGSVNPTDQLPAPDGYGVTPNNTPFNGEGSQLTPKSSSEAISSQKTTLGTALKFGRSS